MSNFSPPVNHGGPFPYTGSQLPYAGLAQQSQQQQQQQQQQPQSVPANSFPYANLPLSYYPQPHQMPSQQHLTSMYGPAVTTAPNQYPRANGGIYPNAFPHAPPPLATNPNSAFFASQPALPSPASAHSHFHQMQGFASGASPSQYNPSSGPSAGLNNGLNGLTNVPLLTSTSHAPPSAIPQATTTSNYSAFSQNPANTSLQESRSYSNSTGPKSTQVTTLPAPAKPLKQPDSSQSGLPPHQTQRTNVQAPAAHRTTNTQGSSQNSSIARSGSAVAQKSQNSVPAPQPPPQPTQNTQPPPSMIVPQSKSNYAQPQEKPTITQNPPNAARQDRQSRREAAKSALQVLHDHNIDFAQLAAESIDLAVLMELYQELGLSVARSGLASGPDKASQFSLPSSSLPQSSQVQSVQQTVAQPDSSSATAPPGIPQAARDGQAPTKAANLANTALPSASAAKPVDRKEYIAKLLAAKQGNGAEAVKPSPEIPAAPPATVLAASVPADRPTEQSTAEAPPLNKTALLRQRLEALKAEEKGRKVSVTSSKTQSASQNPIAEVSMTPAGHTERSETMISQNALPSPHPQRPEPLQAQAVDEAYSPANSYFAANHGTIQGGLPGLDFMRAMPPSLAPSEGAASLLLADDPAAPTDGMAMMPVRDHKSSVSDTEPPILTNDTVINASVRVPLAPAPANVSRKRATAADFIDSPAERIKRRVPQDEPVSVVIDVSEDEGEVLEDAFLQPPPSLEPRASATPRSLRDLPPLSGVASRASAGPAAASTPPPSSIRELAQTEEQIRLLHERIARLEKRKLAKQVDGDKENQTTQDEGPNSAMTAAAAIRATENSLSDAQHVLVAQHKSLEDSRGSLQRTLEIERRTQALLESQAAAEREKADRAARQSERSARAERTSKLQDRLAELDAINNAAQKRLDDVLKQQELVRAEIEMSQRDRQHLLEELDTLLASVHDDGDQIDKSPSEEATEDDTMAVERDSREPEDGNMQENASFSNSESSAATESPASGALEETMDISSGEEGQIEETPDELANSSANEADSEPESDEDLEEPAELSQEIQSFSEHSHDLEDSTEAVSNDEEESQAYSPEVDEIGEPDVSVGEVSPSQTPFSAALLESHQSVSEHPTSASKSPAPPFSPSTGSHAADLQNLAPDGDLSEEGEIEDEHDEVGDDDLAGSHSGHDSDDYEPPDPSNDDSGVAIPMTLDEPDPATIPSGRVPGIPGLAMPSEPHDAQHAYKDEENQAIPTVHARSPPQQEPPGELSLDATAMQTLATEKDDQHCLEPAAAPVPEHSYGHFTPYESPLTRFKSYRFHPQYVSTVPGGFRSLTYSHKINANEPMCRWELAGGVCNDASCSFQHFRDLALSDNTILLELGSVREGETPEQRDAFVAGLRQIITEMRDRNLKDISSVASEIAAYRLRFLNDPSRVLAGL